jgi:tetratricopeptide (TPR) repeat protein
MCSAARKIIIRKVTTETNTAMKCKRLFFFFAQLVMLAFHVSGQNPDEMAAQAAKAYNSHNYPQTIEQYSKIIAGGYESWSLYYNLGNACFRNNENTQAVYFYEKALKLAPNNEDIRHNIEVVNSRLTDKVEQVPELFYKRWWKALVNLMEPDTLAWITILLFSLALTLIALYIAISGMLARKIFFWSGIALLLLSGMGILASEQRHHYLSEDHEAIVFTPTVNIKSSPDENSKDIFVLHEGTKVSLLDEVADWQEIRIANGSIGWIRLTDIRKI